MSGDSNHEFRRGHNSGDINHWYSSGYWRSNCYKISSSSHSQQQTNRSTLHKQSNEEVEGVERVKGVEGVANISNIYLLRSFSESNLGFDSIQSNKRSNDCNESTKNQKRLKSIDPFDSPEPMIKDFRLTNTNVCNSMVSPKDLYCDICKARCGTSLDYCTHLNGKRHKNNLRNDLRSDSSFQSDSNQLHRFIRQSKDRVFGLNYMKEVRKGFYSCGLCKCYEMNVFNALQHIKGFRHERNFTTKQKESEDRRKRSEERDKRQTEKRLHRNDISVRDDDRRHKTKSASNTSSSCISRDILCDQFISEYETERNNSCEKTIENFKTIREICDQMIKYFSEKQKTKIWPKNSSVNTKSTECLNSKIKKEF